MQKAAPLIFELMLAMNEPIPYVSLSPNHDDYSTTLTLDDTDQLEEYLMEHFLEDLGLPDDEDLLGELQDRLYEERQALEAYLNSWLSKLTRALWNAF